MRILLVTPAASGTRLGNRVTALRMSALLRGLGHQVKLRTRFEELHADVMIALHAGKSAQTVLEACEREKPIPTALVLTGTDIYRDEDTNDPAIDRSLALAQRLVILQPNAIDQVPVEHRAKTRLILQSAAPRPAFENVEPGLFRVCVLAHLRPVKDPLLAARAARLLPDHSKVRVRLLGQALEEASRVEAETEARENPRFEWLGPRSYAESQRELAGSNLLVVSSLSEGGPAVVTEAFASGVPVLATRIPACEGLMGADHPGLYPVRDARALADLLLRCEEEPEFLELLRSKSLEKQPDTFPEREQRDLAQLVKELTEA